METQTEQKKFIVRGWVEVAVFSEIEAKDLKGAERKFKKLNEEGNVNWCETNWESEVKDIQINEEVLKE